MSSVFSALNNNNRTPVDPDDIKHNLRVTISHNKSNQPINGAGTSTADTVMKRSSPTNELLHLSPQSAPHNLSSLSPNRNSNNTGSTISLSDILSKQLSASPPRSPSKHGRLLDNSLVIPASPRTNSRINTPLPSPGLSGINRIQSIKRFYYPKGKLTLLYVLCCGMILLVIY